MLGIKLAIDTSCARSFVVPLQIKKGAAMATSRLLLVILAAFYLSLKSGFSQAAQICQETSSSFVHEVCYDEEIEQLRLKLKNRYYTYCAVPSSVASALLRAGSKGRYYNINIKGRYPC